jgi:hypothetical protein
LSAVTISYPVEVSRIVAGVGEVDGVEIRLGRKVKLGAAALLP